MNYICAIVKDEHDYIREWVLHNKSIGFDQIILYDNLSSKPYDDVLSDLIAEDFVKIRSWPSQYNNRQLTAYEDFVKSSLWNENDWCAFIDPDEFIYFDGTKTVSDFVESYAEFAGVILCWKCYNANSYINKPQNISTVNAYTKEKALENFDYNFKTIAKLNKIAFFPDPHRIVPNGKEMLVSTSREPVFNSYMKCDYAEAHIKHYITKSWEDYVKRLVRGNITSGLRNIDTFFKFNPEMRGLKPLLVEGLDISDLPTIKPKKNAFWLKKELLHSQQYSKMSDLINDENMNTDDFRNTILSYFLEITEEAAYALYIKYCEDNEIDEKTKPQIKVAIRNLCLNLYKKQYFFILNIEQSIYNYRKIIQGIIIDTPYRKINLEQVDKLWKS